MLELFHRYEIVLTDLGVFERNQSMSEMFLGNTDTGFLGWVFFFAHFLNLQWNYHKLTGTAQIWTWKPSCRKVTHPNLLVQVTKNRLLPARQPEPSGQVFHYSVYYMKIFSPLCFSGFVFTEMRGKKRTEHGVTLSLKKKKTMKKSKLILFLLRSPLPRSQTY